MGRIESDPETGECLTCRSGEHGIITQDGVCKCCGAIELIVGRE